MALRKRKPTSPGRRFQTVSDFSEITKDQPGEVAPRPRTRRRVVATPTAARRRATAVAATSASTASSTSSAPRTACRPRSPPSSTTPTAPAASLLLHYHDGEKALRARAPKGVKVGDRLQSGQGSEIRPGNALPAALHPRRHHRAQRGAAARPGRQDGPLRRLQRAAGGQGGRLRHPAPAHHRDAPRAHRLPGHRRRGRQRRGTS